MEINILDSLLRRIDVVDEFESLIWTERYNTVGDFEIVTPATLNNRNRFVPDVCIMVTGSKRVMRIETVETTTDLEKGSMLKVAGKEISSILDARVALRRIDSSTFAPSWFIEGKTPANTMRHIFKTICVDGSISVGDVIPFFQQGETLYPASTIPELADLIEWEQKPSSVYAALVELGDIYDLGHRLYKDLDAPKLYFDVYSGSDRTTSQTVHSPVVFSPDLENFNNTKDYTTLGDNFNVAHVVYVYKDENTEEDAARTEIVYDDYSAPSPAGFSRRVKVVNITSIPDEVTDIPLFLFQAGWDELMKSRPFQAYDGEVDKNGSYVYEKDYYLGDLVETRGYSGSTSHMKVVEHIRVQDAEGERAYPTLVARKFISPGTWRSWKYDVDWASMGSGEYWNNQ